MVSEKSKNRNSTLAEKFHIDDHKPKNNKTEKIMLMSGTSFDLNANVPFSQLHLLYEKIIYPTVLKDREQ